jgi:hypothetical protein
MRFNGIVAAVAFVCAACIWQASAEEPAAAPKAGAEGAKVEQAVATVPAAPPVAVATVEDLEAARQAAAAEARAKVDLDRNLRDLVRRLSTPGWRNAQGELMTQGAAAVPYLIEALGAPQCPASCYALQAPGRALRTRTAAEMAYGTLDSLFRNHSSYQGALPVCDQKAWQEFWTTNAGSIEFGK